MRLEDEYLHKYFDGRPSEEMSWTEYQNLANLLTGYMQFLEEKDWVEDIEERGGEIGEFLISQVECMECGYVWPAIFFTNSKELECPSCGKIVPYKMV